MCARNTEAPIPAAWRSQVAPTVVAAHDAAVSRGDDGYLDPTSRLFVFTEASLLAKGPCCESACRHCPYQDWSCANR